MNQGNVLFAAELLAVVIAKANIAIVDGEKIVSAAGETLGVDPKAFCDFVAAFAKL